MKDSQIYHWYFVWIAVGTILNYMASILVLQSGWIEKHRKLNLLISRICKIDYYVMILLAVYFVVTRPNPGFTTDYDAWRRRTNMNYVILSLMVAAGIFTVWITRKSRCSKCGQRSLHAIYPPVGKFSHLCSKCDYSVISWKYYRDRMKEAQRRTKLKSDTSTSSSQASGTPEEMPSGRQDGAVDAVQAIDESGHTGPA